MTNRGASAVGHLADLDAVEAAAVICLRIWCDGPDARARMRRDLAGALGACEGQGPALEAFEQLCALCARYGRRPLMRHGLHCTCLGADEACFANIVGAAAGGDREDAMLIASLIVRADMAPSLAGLAEVFGLALKRMSLKEAPNEAPTSPGRTQDRTLH